VLTVSGAGQVPVLGAGQVPVLEEDAAGQGAVALTDLLSRPGEKRKT
jgi:hypothetical protein